MAVLHSLCNCASVVQTASCLRDWQSHWGMEGEEAAVICGACNPCMSSAYSLSLCSSGHIAHRIDSFVGAVSSYAFHVYQVAPDMEVSCECGAAAVTYAIVRFEEPFDGSETVSEIAMLMENRYNHCHGAQHVAQRSFLWKQWWVFEHHEYVEFCQFHVVFSVCIEPVCVWSRRVWL